MMISLPNGEERRLSNDIALEEKVKICALLVEEFQHEIDTALTTHTVRYFLNGLANYICWHKEEETETDKSKGILSNSREKQMDRKRYHGKYRKDIPFTDLKMGDSLSIFGEMNNSEE